jgi:predicted ATPase
MNRKPKKAETSDDLQAAVGDLKPERNLLERIIIKGLHGIYDYDIELAGDLTFLFGENGVGKTTIFKMVSEACGAGDGSYACLFDVEFKEFTLRYSDRWSLEIKRHQRSVSGVPETLLQFSFKDQKMTNVMEGNISTLQDAEYDSSAPIFTEVYWKDRRSRTMEDRALKKAYGENSKFNVLGGRPYFWGKGTEELPVWEWLLRARNPIELKEIQREVMNRYGRVFFLTSDRLFESRLRRRYKGSNPAARQLRGPEDEDAYEETQKRIQQQSQDVANLIREINRGIGEKGLNLNRDFISQTLSIIQGETQVTLEEVERKAERLQELKRKSSALMPVGDDSLNFASSRKVALSNNGEIGLGFLDLLYRHLEDQHKSLEIFFDKAEKMEGLLNARFKDRKRFQITKNGFEITLDHGRQIQLHKLSSGEEHQVVMLYWLLFQVEPRSIILIDEPEISLHLELQSYFAGDMEKAIQTNQVQVIAATHSPEIIAHRNDCARRVHRVEK